MSKGDSMLGELLFDEMKVVGEIYWNLKDDNLLGFASTAKDKLSLNEIMSEVVCLDTGENEVQEDTSEEANDIHESVCYVNQFRFMTTTGKTHNGEFFYNAGSLSGDELVAQKMHVICCHETVGFQIHALVCDAGETTSPFSIFSPRKNQGIRFG